MGGSMFIKDDSGTCGGRIDPSINDRGYKSSRAVHAQPMCSN